MPLEAQLGETAPKFVPDPLESALFGVDPFVKKSDIALPATYALLDAAKLSFLPELLETSGLRYDCLFKGKPAQEMRDLSPWLVELEPNHHLTRAHFSNGDAPGDLWHYKLGPIIRCTAEFKAVWRHLRRFVRLRRSDTPDWLYFRFWEEHVLSGLTCSVAQEPLDLAQAMLAPIGDAPQSWILVNAGMRRARLWVLHDPEQARKVAPILHPATVDALAVSTQRAQMINEINRALGAVSENVREAYAAEPRLADLWSALNRYRFVLPDHRVEAIQGYLTMVFDRRQDEAWQILTQSDQGPKVRL